jgi:hypothetical protein
MNYIEKNVRMEFGAAVRVVLEGRVVARDEMGDAGYLVEHTPNGKVKRVWVAPEVVERA